MAFVPLMAAQSPDIQNLLTQLVANDPPPIPSAWPLAPGYWLVATVIVVLIGFALFWYFRTKDWRFINRELKRIKNEGDDQNQIKNLHVLLRWVLYKKLNISTRLSDIEFSERISDALQEPAPLWVNSHYQLNSQTPLVDWDHISKIMKVWKKEASK